MNPFIITKIYDSPCGSLQLGSYCETLCLCIWTDANHRDAVERRVTNGLHSDLKEGTSSVIETTVCQLDEYFAQQRTQFTVPLLFIGTDFQQSVWNALLQIPYGKTITYGEEANNIGKPTAVRAVANANSANAISILVPCHRVIGRNDCLTGYAGGLTAKQYLLDLEHVKSMQRYAHSRV